MDLEFVFRESAFKHGFEEADIRHAFVSCDAMSKPFFTVV
jgi:hypothetical protein